ncbi:Regulation of nuclear pre-mRNA domain-containing protein 1A [Sarcoptes scabiei]|uniref:Regulation of nuclear pre-mRNA domain-containing protein 2 n=1 Tax=Sarcoptes scabiei TaxID=52283 RepID=A0A834VF20_SARSC|nr:Regulation of nuclear pre-mRNA domain-containing protein 1A [Sarcoptes scabiei]
MSSSLNEANLIKKLENVTTSQDSIQTLSLWILHHRSHHKKIVEHWLKCYVKAKNNHLLALFYLANDIVQHAKRKNYQPILLEFQNALKDAVKITNAKSNDQIVGAISRVLTILQERSVYSKEFIDELRDSLCGEKEKSKLISTVVSDFSQENLIGKINLLNQLEKTSTIKCQTLANCNADFINSNLLNRLKDKTHGEQCIQELDEAIKCLESTLIVLKQEIQVKNELRGILERSTIYYASSIDRTKAIAERFNEYEVQLRKTQNRLSSMGFKNYQPTLNTMINKTELNSSELSSVLNHFQSSTINSCNTINTTPSSLDQRLTSLMSSVPQFPLNNQTQYNPVILFSKTNSNNNNGNNLTSYNRNDKTEKFDVNQIQSVVTSRSEENRSENFEPADMDLGDSEDEDRHHHPSQLLNQPHQQQILPQKQFNNGGNDLQSQPIIQPSLSFLGNNLSNQNYGGMMMIPPPPPPPLPPTQFENFASIENDLETFRQSQSKNIPIIDFLQTANDSVRNSMNRNLNSQSQNHSSDSYHHHAQQQQQQWRSNINQESISNRHQSNHDYYPSSPSSAQSNSSNRHNRNTSKWKNSNSGGHSWKRSNYDDRHHRHHHHQQSQPHSHHHHR